MDEVSCVPICFIHPVRRSIVFVGQRGLLLVSLYFPGKHSYFPSLRSLQQGALTLVQTETDLSRQTLFSLHETRFVSNRMSPNNSTIPSSASCRLEGDENNLYTSSLAISGIETPPLFSQSI